jgi:DNA-directed RNA polymerase sigma subunit (sigma70/sigma32)
VREETTAMDQLNGTLFFESILACIQDDIERPARDLYFSTRVVISVSIEDLIQEGMIGAWIASTRYDESKVTNKHSLNAYCKTYAKYAMLRHIEKHKPDLSLEAYLEGSREGDTVNLDIQDNPVKSVETPPHKRNVVLDALNCISPRRKIVIMAAFQIEDEQGMVTMKEDIGISNRIYDDAKAEALKKLRTIINIENLQIQNGKVNVNRREECRKLLRQDPTMKPRDLIRLTGCSATNAAKARAEMKRMT